MTMMVMQWGQFISHDVSFTPMSRGFNKSMIKCCSKEGQQVSDVTINWRISLYNPSIDLLIF
jgi:hypothetical protein